MIERFSRERVEGVEVLKHIDRAEVRNKAVGWETTLIGMHPDGRPGKETMPLRVRKELAEADVPPGVEITYVEPEKKVNKDF